MDELAFTYVEEEAPITGTVVDRDKDGQPIPGSARYTRGGFDGVPTRDLTVAEFAALPERLKLAVKSAPFYAPVKKKIGQKKDGE